jgi:hypothetical protein
VSGAPDNSRVLDFGRVSRELRSVVARRRELILFLGSLFAGMGIYIQNVLDKKLPPSLAMLERSAFLTFSVGVLIPSVIVALRLAKLHSGMIINGVFFSKLRQHASQSPSDLSRAGRLNWMGVSTQFFAWTAVLAGFSAGLLALSLRSNWSIVGFSSVGTFALLLSAFLNIHRRARKFATGYAVVATCESYSSEELEDHLAESMKDGNHDMLACISFVGLMVFSIFQAMSGLGDVKSTGTELSRELLRDQGVMYLSALLLVTTLIGLVVYLRLLISIGNFSLLLDPTDRPFRLFKLTDSFLGYCLLVFFLALSVHVLAVPLLPKETTDLSAAWLCDAAAAGLTLLVYALVVLVAAWRVHTRVPGGAVRKS